MCCFRILNIGHSENFSKMDKEQILAKFSADPDRYYKVTLFENEGFVRKSCAKCRRYFWTLDINQNFCPDDSENNYSFIGNPPTKKRFDYVQAWREVESFFVQNGHKSVSRYPVVCRWRDDLYFTIASIVDFQRVMGSKVIFEFPANPLVVPQTCLRFKDIENVGVTGRHFSSFCMIGQHSIPNSQGYWKDKCVDLDFRLLTERFGINKKEVVFVEDVWAGGGSFGSSLEYFVRGLELGNAVFTEFQGDLDNYSVLDQKIIDMGAGLERFAWITMGTPTAYDCCFGPITKNLIQKTGIDLDSKIISNYFISIPKSLGDSNNISIARKIAAKQAGIDEIKFNKTIAPLEGIYLIADHLRTLVFAISDGDLPSNVSGGYNLRMILRRTVATMDRFGWNFDLKELVDMHIDYLKSTYPELEETRNDVKTIIGIERERYNESKTRMKSIASTLKNQDKQLTIDELIRLYESDGITPDFLKETQIITEIPTTIYERLTDLHQSEKQEKKEDLDLKGIPDTELLYYQQDPEEFEAKVLKVIKNKLVVLNKTSFYPRGGGQEPDHGKIGTFEVIDVNKHGNVVVHELERGLAEQKYGFRIYQGGVVPVKLVRIVNIEGYDVEACGGTHVKKTGEIGLIKITKAERIQDGVVRMEFVSGETAIKYTQNQDRKISQIVKSLGSSKEKILESFEHAIRDADSSKKKLKQLIKRVSEPAAKNAISQAKNLGKV